MNDFFQNRFISKIMLSLAIATLCLGILLMYKSSQRKLLPSAENNDWKTVAEILNKGLSAEILERDGMKVLYKACNAEEIQIIDLLIEQGVDLNIKTAYSTPLLYCFSVDKLHIAKHLIAKGADVNIRGGHGYPIHKAISSGSVEGVKLLIEAGADLSARTRKTYWTALHVAIRTRPKHFKNENDRLEIVKLLIDNGADVNAYNRRWSTLYISDSSPGRRDPPPLKNRGGTPLDLAISNGFDEIAQLLIDNGAKKDPEKTERGMPGMPNEVF